MAGEAFIRDGVTIRRLKPGLCVLERHWQPYIFFNRVGASGRSGCVVPFLLENERFEELIVPHKPFPEHHPPVLRFGFAIRNQLGAQNRRPNRNRGHEKHSFGRVAGHGSHERAVRLPARRRHQVPSWRRTTRNGFPRTSWMRVVGVVREVLSVPKDVQPK